MKTKAVSAYFLFSWEKVLNEIKRDIQANPIIAEGKIFLPTTGNKIISIDAINGKKIWEYIVDSTPARRGLVFNSNNNKSRIYFCAEKNLISLDKPKTANIGIHNSRITWIEETALNLS